MKLTKQDVTVFTESAAVKVGYILLRLTTPSRHNRAIRKKARLDALDPVAFRHTAKEDMHARLEKSRTVTLHDESDLPRSPHWSDQLAD